MKRKAWNTTLLAVSATALLGAGSMIAGCEEEDPVDEAVDNVEDAVDDASDGIEDAADDVGDAIEDATDDP